MGGPQGEIYALFLGLGANRPSHFCGGLVSIHVSNHACIQPKRKYHEKHHPSTRSHRHHVRLHWQRLSAIFTLGGQRLHTATQPNHQLLRARPGPDWLLHHQLNIDRQRAQLTLCPNQKLELNMKIFLALLLVLQLAPAFAGRILNNERDICTQFSCTFPTIGGTFEHTLRH